MAAEHGPDPRGKLAPGEGLGHIIIGTKPEPDRPVDIAVLGGEHDHRHIRPLAQAPAHVGTRWPREHEVEQHQVGPWRSKASGASGPVRQIATWKPSLRSGSLCRPAASGVAPCRKN